MSACDVCRYGMTDPVTGILYKKSVSLLRNFEQGCARYLFRRCDRTHETHQPVEGMFPGHGSRTALTQVYPRQFCTTLARCVADALWPQRDTLVNDATQTTFIEDLLAHLPDKALPQVDKFLQRRYCGLLLQEEKETATLLPLKKHISDASCVAKMQAAERLAAGTEYLLVRSHACLICVVWQNFFATS